MQIERKIKKREPIFNNIPLGVLSLGVIILLIEVVIQIFGSEFRSLFLIYFGFFPGNIMFLTEDLFFGQKYLMFITYSLIHGSFFHMALNLCLILALGKKLEEHLGHIKLWILFFSTASFGAFFYLLILPNEQLPMVGASGSIFGFFGYWKGRELLFRLEKRMPMEPIMTFLFALIVANFLMVLFLPFGLAWQAHLGGIVFGFFLAFFPRFFRSNS